MQNTFNDFHSRDGAPDDEPFFTLAEHAERILAKEQALNELADDTNVRKSDVPQNTDERDTATPVKDTKDKDHIGDTEIKKDTDLVKKETDEGTAENEKISENPEGESSAAATAACDDSDTSTTPVHVVQQHLLITEPMPVPSDALQKHECNMTGESLLPNLKPHDWPSVQQIAQAQSTMPAAARRTMRSVETAVPDVSLLTNADGKIVIPANHIQMVSIICAAAHQGHHGHVKEKAMRDTIKECFWWAGMNKDIKEWAKKCLLCIKLAGGDLIPRPMGYQLRATQPMEVVSIDYMDMPRSAKKWGFKAILVVVDQLTRICIMVPTKDKTASTAARILVERWLSFFPDPAFLMSDGGTHFKCELFKKLAEIRGFQHHIIAPYSQWGNGGVENLNKAIVKATKAITHANDIEITDWPATSPAIQECMNKRIPISSRDNRTPIELLTGLAPKSAIKHIAWLGVDATTGIDIPDDVIRTDLNNVHEELRKLWSQAVQSQVKRAARNRKTKSKCLIPRINIGDYVLVARHVKNTKLDMQWTGPHRVINAKSPFVFDVEPVLKVKSNKKPIQVHIVRIRRFSAGALGTPADRDAIERAALKDYPDNVVKRFVSHTYDNTRAKKMLIRVRWMGYDQAHDTHEDIATLVEDVPDMAEHYLRQHVHEPECYRMLQHYFPV